jgi:hypothetical protein
MKVAGQPIVDSVAEKVMEAIERIEHLVSLVPANRLEWRPELPPPASRVGNFGELLAHLVVCLSGFCAAFYRAFPGQLADFVDLRSMAVYDSCSPAEARAKISLYAAQIQRGFRCCTDEDLARQIPTVFVPEGQALLKVLLGNLEHLTNHKYQLFFHLKLAGVPVGSRDIYKWREVPERGSQATVESE